MSESRFVFLLVQFWFRFIFCLFQFCIQFEMRVAKEDEKKEEKERNEKKKKKEHCEACRRETSLPTQLAMS